MSLESEAISIELECCKAMVLGLKCDWEPLRILGRRAVTQSILRFEEIHWLSGMATGRPFGRLLK
jgi:hypothetical protein